MKSSAASKSWKGLCRSRGWDRGSDAVLGWPETMQLRRETRGGEGSGCGLRSVRA